MDLDSDDGTDITQGSSASPQALLDGLDSEIDRMQDELDDFDLEPAEADGSSDMARLARNDWHGGVYGGKGDWCSKGASGQPEFIQNQPMEVDLGKKRIAEPAEDAPMEPKRKKQAFKLEHQL